jgi:predicted acetyltransferase
MINYIQDSLVDERLDKKIIELLSVCFVKEPLFQTQRFFKEKPQHRWYIEDDRQLVAQLAVHEKTISTECGDYEIGGIAEVAVHPQNRGKGYVKQLLKEAHRWLQKNEFPFAMLFGETYLYSSSGYSLVANKIKFFDDKIGEWRVEVNPHAMKKVLGKIAWPSGAISINGPTF